MKTYQIEQSLSNAEKIEFWHEPETEQPPLVILVFKNDKSVLENKCSTAYDELYGLVSLKTSFMKTSILNDTITIFIVDAVGNLHLTIPHLKFDLKQFEGFKKSLIKNRTFAFLLGKVSSRDRPEIFLPSDESEIITLAGFIGYP